MVDSFFCWNKKLHRLKPPNLPILPILPTPDERTKLMDEQTMKCVACGNDFMHLERIYCSLKCDGGDTGTSAEVSQSGQTGLRIITNNIQRSDDRLWPRVAHRGRELGAVLVFDCEHCKAKTRMEWGFHKGRIMTSTELDTFGYGDHGEP